MAQIAGAALLAGLVAVGSGCKKDVDDTEVTEVTEVTDDTSDPCTGDLVVCVEAGDMPTLYAVVQDAAYAGYRVVLEPGTYTLDPDVDPDGTGVLVLQEGMELVGGNTYRDDQGLAGSDGPDGLWDPWDPTGDPKQYPDPVTETVIDCEAVQPPTREVAACGEDPDVSTLRSSPVSLVHDSALRNLTVRDYNQDFIGVVSWDPTLMGAALPPEGELHAEVTDCVIEATDGTPTLWASFGLSVLLTGCEVAGRTGSVHVEGNVLRHTGYAAGTAMSLLTEDTELAVDLQHNRFEDARRGFQAIAGSLCERCEMAVSSTDNAYWRNRGAGLAIAGGADTSSSSRNGAHDNVLAWTSTGDRILDNGASSIPGAFGGVAAWGAVAHAPRELGTSGNQLQAVFQDVVFVSDEAPGGNLTPDGPVDVVLWGFQDRSGAAVGELVHDNTASLQMDGCVGSGSDDGKTDPVYNIPYDHSSPDDPRGTNLVSFVGGRESIIEDNQGCYPPP